jgi:hypothetical protein
MRRLLYDSFSRALRHLGWGWPIAITGRGRRDTVRPVSADAACALSCRCDQGPLWAPAGSFRIKPLLRVSDLSAFRRNPAVRFLSPDHRAGCHGLCAAPAEGLAYSAAPADRSVSACCRWSGLGFPCRLLSVIAAHVDGIDRTVRRRASAVCHSRACPVVVRVWRDAQAYASGIGKPGLCTSWKYHRRWKECRPAQTYPPPWYVDYPEASWCWFKQSVPAVSRRDGRCVLCRPTRSAWLGPAWRQQRLTESL